MFKRGQTATEYLIILAVVIIIGLIVVAVLGGIPGIGGGTGSRAAQTQLATAAVGVTSHAVTNESILVTLRNNQQETIVITNVSLDGEILEGCTELPLTLQIGQSREIVCTNLDTIGAQYEREISVDYQRQGVSFTETPGSLTGTVGGAAPGSTPETFVPDPGDVQITAFSSNVSGTLEFGGSINLTWIVENADSCEGSDGWSGLKNQNGGSEVISNLEETTTFTLTCTGEGPDAVEQVTVTVQSQTTDFLPLGNNHDFENGLDGWDYEFYEDIVSWNSTAGNPGGASVHHATSDARFYHLDALMSNLEPHQQYDLIQLRFDYRVLNTAVDWSIYFLYSDDLLDGSDWQEHFVLVDLVESGNWHTVEVNISNVRYYFGGLGLMPSPNPDDGYPPVNYGLALDNFYYRLVPAE